MEAQVLLSRIYNIGTHVFSGKFNFRKGNAVTGKWTNVPTYLDIPTYDGSGQAVHPDVLYTPDGWNGYKYIMCYTPYPYQNVDYENPSIAGSNDGIHWYNFTDCPNPVIAQPPVGFNTDPNIALINNTLYLFNRYCMNEDGSGSQIFWTSCTNPNSWTTPTLTDLPDIISPSFHYDGSVWHCWATANYHSKSRNFMHYTSTNMINWAVNGTVSLSIPGYIISHGNVKPIDGGYEALISAIPTNNSRTIYLFYQKSPDGLVWELTTGNPVLCPSASSWDNYEIYESCLLKFGDMYKVWYSARNKHAEWHIGYITVNTNTM